ncbi:uncharacterized protein E0L32_011680 [Thyridium curvatum]|uniref:C3H1-type domain-containing protein n=1 Tax=Thyridium curvatum TaxID=1093900 RepID=A0A507BLS5_9PEZI|nr:uncharacterized protein E0L32_011680 [Thyridium curvatum]TPX18439.1 hypothetical protein E0L32_011680 [Thyridium curvatum]
MIFKRIDTIVATSSSANPSKKTKIWCDKWIHDGICAFTQQGCKFKHEMPLDKATQFSVGLFHGLPNWYKKQQSEMATARQIQDLGDDNQDVFDRPIVMPGDAHRRIGRHMPTDSGFGMVSPEAGSRPGPSGWRRFSTQPSQAGTTNVSRPRTLESPFPLSPGPALSTPTHGGIMTRYPQLPTPTASSPPRQDFGPIGTPRRGRPISGLSTEGFPATLNYDEPQSPAGKDEDVDAKFYPTSEHTAVKGYDKAGAQ